MKQRPEWVERKRQAIKEAWKDPEKYKRMRKQGPEILQKRAEGMRAYYRSKDPKVVENIRDRHSKIARSLTGRKLSAEHRDKAVKTLIPVNELSAETEARRRRNISKAKIGTHGYGRAARDNPNHHRAKHWIFRDPAGEIHECDNLYAWWRKNEHLAEPDDRPEATMPLWRRAVGGFNDMRRRDGKGLHSWKGWTLVSRVEREEMGAPDLLGRGVADR